jgi:PAS domain S-box-containing protein
VAGWGGALATNEAVFAVDETGTIQYWNEGARRLTGYEEGEVLGKRCYSVLCGRRSGRSWCQADCRARRFVQRGELPNRIRLEMRARDGGRFPVGVTFLVLPGPGGKTIAHLLDDASREERMRQTLREVRRLVQELGVSRSPGALPAAPPPGRRTHAGAAVDLSVLTRREIEVLRLLAEGLSTDAIGTRLGVSRLTARNHIQHAVRKLGLRTRAQAVAAALEQRLV